MNRSEISCNRLSLSTIKHMKFFLDPGKKEQVRTAKIVWHTFSAREHAKSGSFPREQKILLVGKWNAHDYIEREDKKWPRINQFPRRWKIFVAVIWLWFSNVVITPWWARGAFTQHLKDIRVTVSVPVWYFFLLVVSINIGRIFRPSVCLPPTSLKKMRHVHVPLPWGRYIQKHFRYGYAAVWNFGIACSC